MEVPRHVLRRYFEDTRFPIIQHHIDSYDDFLNVGIPRLIKVTNESDPFQLGLKDGRMIKVFIGGKDGKKIAYLPPVEEDNGSAITPHACRLDNRTYALSLYADIEIEYTISKDKVETVTLTNILIGKFPLMLRSSQCYLTGMPNYDIGECKYELGGYFIVGGAEKVLMTQELLGNNMFASGSRTRKAPKGTKSLLIESDAVISFSDITEGEKGVEYEEITETYVSIKTMSEDGTRGPFSHFLTIPSPTLNPGAKNGVEGRDNRLAMINLKGFNNQPVPLISIFRALGCSSDRDIYETTLAGVADRDRLAYDDILYQLILSHDKFLVTSKKTDLEILTQFTRSKSPSEIILIIHDILFSHIEDVGDDVGGMLRKKAYLLGAMLRMALDVESGRTTGTDRDNIQNKRFKTSGVLMFEEFRRIFRENGKEMLVRMDKRLTYEAGSFKGDSIKNLVGVENIGYLWRRWYMLSEFSRSFKGMWGDIPGVSQELMRVSYLSVIHYLRKTDLQIDKSTSTAPPRRLYASQFGVLCPIDSPDGSDIGYKKALTIFAQVTTAFSSKIVKDIALSSKILIEVRDIHPSTWLPEWTKIYINSDLWAVCVGDTEALHNILLNARRSGALPTSVSLSWMRINNEYRIACDAGRPIRPVYRPGTTPNDILGAKTWSEIAKHLDYIDAAETDSMRISLVPFHPTMPSEIHMTFNMSALANMVPYSDHNPSSRSVFSIAQQKAAAGWYHTNYKKRFDTIAEFLCMPQKPLSQTWLYNEIMGRGGCLPYGENVMVAITMYGGNNQEDSMIMNGSALKRGLFRTLYSHSYDHAEDFIGMPGQDEEGHPIGPHTQIKNPTNYEGIKRKEEYNYDLLDQDGIIRLNSIVDDKTILVGMVTPILTPTGATKGYRDVSIEPKRGQTGRVDAIYQYTSDKGLRGVKIRIVEDRTPIVGDKMSSRHSQKGTIGEVLREEDMPFTSTGMRPDLIFNPHGIPTRMTIGQFLEPGTNKLGLKLGSFVDATPFTVQNRVKDLRQSLLDMGFEPNGHEVLYNGMTGEQMEADIFMGPIFYQRLKQMVEDKISYRNTGPKAAMTHQPTQGRSNEGGMRIGEMERDGLISHGMSKFIEESFMKRSDGAEFVFNKETGQMDTSRDTIAMPYAMALFTQELRAMHVEPRIETSGI
jgi:DNA-directed RNA polymerase II subunit RPB2